MASRDSAANNVSASLFDNLSVDEVAAATGLLIRSLGLTNLTFQGLGDSYVAGLELLLPPKAQAVAYLEGKGGLPPREALALVVRPGQGDVMRYRVGPLPRPTSVTPLTEPNQISINHRPPDYPEGLGMETMVAWVAGELKVRGLVVAPLQRSF